MIDPSRIERELEAVFAQRRQANEMMQQAANVIQQSVGAEKAFQAVLQMIKDSAAASEPEAPLVENETHTHARQRRKAQGAGK